MSGIIEKLVKEVYDIQYSADAKKEIENSLKVIEGFINENHFLNSKSYTEEIRKIEALIDDLSIFKSSDDKLLQRSIQKRIANLGRTILEENKKIFIVHGRNFAMRDKVSSMLGKLKLDYSILETEHNNGATIIEKFLRNASECKYAIVLFSADDIGKIDSDNESFRHRTRQNVILELGYFLGQVGRKNIVILHEVGKNIEKPSDFDGIVYEAFDDYGAWKSKIIKEMKSAGIYIDERLASRA